MKKYLLFTALIFSISTETLAQTEEMSVSERINRFFSPIVEVMASVLFYDPFEAIGIYDATVYDENGKAVLNADGSVKKQPIPLVVAWLIFGAIFFTIRMKFINLRGLRHAFDLVRGKYKAEHSMHQGEVSHFQALATALSATVGLGNIAGVAVAVSLGGPGATFWMIVAGFLGMTSKFTECTLGVKYRHIDKKGRVFGGPMFYLKEGFARIGFPQLGQALSVIFALLCIGGSFGGGNMFQANQAFEMLAGQIPALKPYGFEFGVIVALMVGAVIIGGIRTIARVTDKLVPLMCGIYVVASLVIIGMNISLLPKVCYLILSSAFSNDAMYGGFVGVVVQGFRRAVFSNEAGVGSSSIAHSAVRTSEPITEGLVALLEPFIDTIVVCTMTALVIIITEMYKYQGVTGVQLTNMAFASQISWFPYVLTLTVFLFAFSTMIAWSYYGTIAWAYLFGKKKRSIVLYKIIFLCFIVIGSSTNMRAVIDFSDMMILGMAFPNILGLVLMSKEVYEDLENYLAKVKSSSLNSR
ncbi:MAG: alanine:cation symporter family protein [Cytophagales bacterium]|nr:alanine:cation symporter family protein [Cytophagales bacterium]MDW8383634.1 alanine/glycine:cation symporter family protein [Flammeovirgaceae bacterium]